ncbi:MAG: GNAT family N-acetyltransferase [Pyrinomonadaceae bacterium]
MKIEFVPADPTDEEIFLDLVRDYYEFEEFSFDPEKIRRSFHKLIKNENLGKIWLILFEKKQIGYIVLTYGFSFESGGPDALIDEVFILPDHRRLGIGRKVFEFLYGFCRRTGLGKIYLEVERKNLAAQKFYRAEGFLDHDRYLLSKKISDQ